MDDLISRQAALDALEWKWAGKVAIDAIKNLPSVKRKKNTWIKRGKIFQCPECEKFSITQDNYCSNCGADMREEKNDAEDIH